MAGPAAPRSAEEGSDTPSWLATIPEPGESGLLWGERTIVNWDSVQRWTQASRAPARDVSRKERKAEEKERKAEDRLLGNEDEAIGISR